VEKIRVLLADDHPILSAGLRAFIGDYDDMEVVGEARNGQEVVALAAELKPDVVLMDIAMPGMNGIEATHLIREQQPETQVLVLTQHEERQYVPALFRAGASGYILKRAMGSDLIAALRTVARGEPFLCPSVGRVLLEELYDPGAHRRRQDESADCRGSLDERQDGRVASQQPDEQARSAQHGRVGARCAAAGARNRHPVGLFLHLRCASHHRLRAQESGLVVVPAFGIEEASPCARAALACIRKQAAATNR